MPSCAICKKLLKVTEQELCTKCIKASNKRRSYYRNKKSIQMELVAKAPVLTPIYAIQNDCFEKIN